MQSWSPLRALPGSHRRENANRSRAELSIARGAFYPQISAFSRVGTGEDSFRAESQFDDRAGLRASQRIFDFGQSSSRRNAAAARLSGSEHRAEWQTIDVAVEAARHHLGVTRAETRASAAAMLRDHLDRHLNTVVDQLQAGLLKRSEAAAIRAEAARGFAAETEERLLAEQERTSLRTLVQAPVECVDAASARSFLVAGTPPSLDSALADAIAGSAELKTAEALARAADHEVRQEKRSHLPEVSLTGVAAYNFGLGSNVSGRSSRIGVDLSFPLYQGGQLRGQTLARSADARAAAYAVEQERRKVIEEVNIAWARVNHLAVIAERQQDAVAALNDQAEALDEEFLARLVTLDEVTDARRDEYQMRLDYADTLFQLGIERLNLMRHTSRLQNVIHSGATAR